MPRELRLTGPAMMNSKSTTRRALGVIALSALSLAGRVSAQGNEDPAAYPSRPITIVVGFTPAGATDLIARMVATKLSAALGKPVIVDNKPGAGSNIATEYVVRAKPDGYTLLVETIANATNMSVYKNLKYDSARDLSPIIQFM